MIYSCQFKHTKANINFNYIFKLIPTSHKTISPVVTITKNRKLMLFSKIIRFDSEKFTKQINGVNEHNVQPLKSQLVHLVTTEFSSFYFLLS